MKQTVLIITLLITQFTFSQNFKFGKVSVAELSETIHSLEPNTNAAILYREQKINFEFVKGSGFVQENYIHERIKIYNKDGYDYTTKQIRLYDENNGTRDKLVNFKAYTYNLKDGIIEETKLKNDGVFEEKTNRYWKKTKFTMPNINDGCIIEFRYTIQSKLLGIDDIPLQKFIPINKLDFKVSSPEYFLYKTLLNPKAVFYPKLDKTSEKGKITFNEFERTQGQPSKLNTETVDYKKNVILANLTNVPSLKNEAFVDNLQNYQAKLIMELSAIEYPNQVRKSYANSWEDVSKTIYRNEDFGGQLNKTNYFKKDINALLEGITNPEEKTVTIYNFVKSKVKWNNLIGYYADLGVSKAYKEGTGNVADINLMLVAMLRDNGLQANPVLVSTRSNGIPITATKSGFNYVIAAVEFSDGIILLDASSTFATANILPEHILNWQGRLIREDDSSTWISLQPKGNAKQITYLNATINDDLSINGQAREQLTNHFALKHRQEFNGKNKEVLIRDIEDEKGDIEVSNLEVKAENELSKPILTSYEFTLQNGIEEIADKLYFSSLLFFAPDENPFKQETREYPIDFTYPISEKHVINIKIPEGYQVESLPENAKIQFNGTDGKFTYLINHKDDLLQITSTLEINKTIILPQEYPEFKMFTDLLTKKQTEQIVLKKI